MSTKDTKHKSEWNPEQYDKFKALRSKPFYDLVDLLSSHLNKGETLATAVDLGCGTGDLTAHLHKSREITNTLGVDSSDSMLSKAPTVDNLSFKLQGISEFLDDCKASNTQYDLVFTNAALQWLPDHDQLWPRVGEIVKPKGHIAIQIPSNHDHPSHVLAAEVALEEPFVSHLKGWTRVSPVKTPEFYASILYKMGFREQDVRLQVYGHELESREHVVEWVKGTNLTDYEKRMPADMYAEFLERYKARLLPVLDNSRPHFYPFKRLLMWAKKV